MLRMVATLLGLELERSRSPEWASEEAAGDFVRSLLDRSVTDRGDIAARAAELGADISAGAGVLMARAVPHSTQSGEWRGRVLTLSLRAVRAISSGALAAPGEHAGERAEVVAVIPTDDEARLRRAAEALATELDTGLSGFTITVSLSRLACRSCGPLPGRPGGEAGGERR